MTISAEERRAINLQNSKASTGPKSDRGKKAVSQNALKHGMRAETIALPNEDPAAIRARADEWNEACQPANSMERYLVEQAVKSSLSLDRCREQHTALLAKQVREAPHAWEHARRDELERLKALLKNDPDTAVRELQRSAHGCRWILERWYRLDGILEEQGRWCGPDRDEAIRLLGLRPEADRLQDSEDAFKTRLYNLLCHPNRSDRAVAWLCDPARMPESLQSTYRIDFLPEPADCLKALRAMISERLDPLEDLEEQLRTELDEPDRAEAASRALIPLEESAARLILRYQTTAENSFYRAYHALKKEQKARESGDADDSQAGAVVVEAVVADDPPSAPEPVPNKANPAPPIPTGDPAPPAPASLPNKANSGLPNKANLGAWIDSKYGHHRLCDEASRFTAGAEGPGDAPAGRDRCNPIPADPGQIPGVGMGP